MSSHNARVKEVEFEGRTVISKAAIFGQWIPQTDHETRVYGITSRIPTDWNQIRDGGSVYHVYSHTSVRLCARLQLVSLSVFA
ncbi:hypothetical protein F5B21DRAFT_495590 [Xylaria acuta]|nr:hypothetical protein F5B21DRAFT_495590 [Xylaria acuta]